MYSIEVAKQFSNSLDKERQAQKDRNKKELLSYLEGQVREKQKTKYEPYAMERRELEINKDLLRNSQGIVPGETYLMDPQRKKQLETISKRLSNSPQKNNSQKYNSKENVKELDLSSTSNFKLYQILDLDEFINLRTLILSNNRIAKIENLENLTKHKILNLQFNQIKIL